MDFVYVELGFRGAASYDDPRTELLNFVLAHRVGSPVALALVLYALARRAALPLQLIAFPGHFLVRLEGVYVDPHSGRYPLDPSGLDNSPSRPKRSPRSPPAPVLHSPTQRSYVRSAIFIGPIDYAAITVKPGSSATGSLNSRKTPGTKPIVGFMRWPWGPPKVPSQTSRTTFNTRPTPKTPLARVHYFNAQDVRSL